MALRRLRLRIETCPILASITVPSGERERPHPCCLPVVAYRQTTVRRDASPSVSQVRGKIEETGRERMRSAGSVEPLASLTPLRGIAALWVVLYHLCQHMPNLHPEHYTGAVQKGYLAVDMFFVLSGFVITHAYKDGFARGVTGPRYRNFLKARVARLYPLHIVVLLLFVAAVTVKRIADYALTGSFSPIPLLGERSIDGFFANLLMLQGVWARELSWNDPSWSISLEFLAYLLFPLLFSILWRVRPLAKAGLGALLLAVLAWLACRTGDDFNQWNGVCAILRCLPEFLIGSLLYTLYRGSRCAAVLAGDAALGALLVLLGILLHTAAPDLVIILLFPLLILTAVRNTGRIGRALNAVPLLWLGNISYSLYLLHWFVLFIVAEIVRLSFGGDLAGLPADAALCATGAVIAASLGLAALGFRFVEIPGRRWLRQRLDVRRPPAVAGMGAPG